MRDESRRDSRGMKSDYILRLARNGQIRDRCERFTSRKAFFQLTLETGCPPCSSGCRVLEAGKWWLDDVELRAQGKAQSWENSRRGRAGAAGFRCNSISCMGGQAHDGGAVAANACCRAVF